MKKLILVILIAIGAWKYNEKQPTPHFDEASASSRKSGLAEPVVQASAPRSFNCDGRVYCSDMTSREEAEYFTRNCPGTKMDGDLDGNPCENDSRF
ncbi:MAG TPA: excalibur calcium-binding domain-containing protein [Thiobacillus sp.]|jgi:hypothetical protein|nr:excalibur calcium-binding domain-containing protein [Gammaproteobacteria bacterium]OYZ29700.1 MAG: hypothetical protein B7Y27_02915 [Hydrogenophilales bacterium 16-64-40]OZA35596.1 MAG: hypothetical protein B7X82_00940 [Hydrogenophilales bacterium 17-64-65]HQS83176.1 excalibur calcium-binding domain-containing protein [Thiobacillus sp.]HQT34213.1 excalibur calcium-binding domain-containing protein [Thiobacillus sp.]